jgi:beta-galactosidase
MKAETRALNRSMASLLVLWLALSIWPAEVLAQANFPKEQARSQGEEAFFPFAVWYGGGKARAPMLEPDPEKNRAAWRADLQKIKDLGFNTVKCWVDWATAEPAPGQYDLRHLRQILELADELGLRVNIQVYVDSAPDWVGVQYPDARFVANSGYVVDSQASPGFCFDHPQVRQRVLSFYAALAREAQKHRSFYGWDLWSEPHIINWASMRFLTAPEFCYCPNTSRRFRNWMQKKYGTLEAVNRAWYRGFTDWSQLEPPRFSTILSYSDYIDWRYFLLDKLAEDLRAKAEAVLKEAPRGVVSSHSASPSIVTSPLAGNGNPDDWKMARVIQYWGLSSYPKHSTPVGLDPVAHGARLDFARSAGYRFSDGFVLGEFQAGFGTVGLRVGAPVTSGDLTNWAWSALARGAKGLNFYAFYPMSSGYESGGFGLIHLDGRITERAKVLGSIAKTVSAHGELFLKARPPKAQVAILYNPLAYMVGGPRRLPAAGAQDEYEGVERDSWMGMYRALFPENVPIDYVHADDIAENGISGYKLLYVPYPIMMSEGTARAIMRFIQEGGCVAAEARTAWNDARGYATATIPGFGLDKIFGVREIVVTPVQRTALIVKSKNAAIPLLQPEARLPGFIYQEALEVEGPGQVLAAFEDGSPAIVASTHGKGKTVYVGSYLSLAYERTRDVQLRRFFQGLLDWAGVERPVSASPGVEVRYLEGPGYTLDFILNDGEKDLPAEVRLRPPFPTPSVRNLVTGEAVSYRQEGSRLVLTKTLPAQGAWVLEIRERGR